MHHERGCDLDGAEVGVEGQGLYDNNSETASR